MSTTIIPKNLYNSITKEQLADITKEVFSKHSHTKLEIRTGVRKQTRS
jgi:hypothetical protein